MTEASHKAVFLDRDGTLNVEKNYVYKTDDFEFIDGAVEAIRLLNENDFLVIVISNQAGIARGFYKPSDVQVLHDYIQSELRKQGAHVDAFFYCPHHPEGKVEEFRKICNCRKPATGMALEAEGKLKLDLKRSFIVGDSGIDMKLGENTGMKSILVKTGHGEETLKESKQRELNYEVAVENILEAVHYILSVKSR